MAIFDYWHDNPPPPFNPDYKPHAIKISNETTKYMESRGYYDGGYTRKELAKIREQVYDKLMKEYEEKM